MNRLRSWCVLGVGLGCLVSTSWAADTDHDGIDDAADVCCNTPAGIAVGADGRPLADFDEDCDVDLMDAALFSESFTAFLPSCNNEDECAQGTHNCNVNATCADRPSGFTCTCNPGFSGNGVTCQDINECNGNPCAGHGTCSNFSGGYACNCHAGYTQSGGTCVDINECQKEGLCGSAGECVNQPGAYSCDCNDGYSNCDASPDCEVNHRNYSSSCANAVYLGSACGDTSQGFGCPDTDLAPFTSRTGRGSAWFKVFMDECSDCCAYLEQRYRLTVPAGVDYDLYLYSACGGALEDSSTNGPGMADDVTAFRQDNCLAGSYQGAFYLIEIRHDNGSSCAEWTLTIEGRE